MKTLNAIQTLSKLGKIVSKVIYHCSLIAAIGRAVGMDCLPFANTNVFRTNGAELQTALLMVCSYAPYVICSVFAGALPDDHPAQ